MAELHPNKDGKYAYQFWGHNSAQTALFGPSSVPTGPPPPWLPRKVPGLFSTMGWFSGRKNNVQGVKPMQKCADMAVHAIPCRKHPLRRATLTQFRVAKASTKAGALKQLGWAAHAWDGRPSLSAPELQRPLTLPTPSNRSHTCARGCMSSAHNLQSYTYLHQHFLNTADQLCGMQRTLDNAVASVLSPACNASVGSAGGRR